MYIYMYVYIIDPMNYDREDIHKNMRISSGLFYTPSMEPIFDVTAKHDGLVWSNSLIIFLQGSRFKDLRKL